MKPGTTLLLILLYILGLPGKQMAQNREPLYRVVLVKGSPLRSGKTELRDGQKIEGHEKIMFTSSADVVVLMTEHFDKLYLRPGNTAPVRKLMRVADFPSYAHKETTKTRGILQTIEIQSYEDTIQLDIVSDLKRRPDVPLSQFSLYSIRMEPKPGMLSLKDQFLYIHSGKPGPYYLYFSKNPGNSEPLAEIEFLDKAELKAELSFIARETTTADSIRVYQRRYLRKQYPKIPAGQQGLILSKEW